MVWMERMEKHDLSGYWDQLNCQTQDEIEIVKSGLFLSVSVAIIYNKSWQNTSEDHFKNCMTFFQIRTSLFYKWHELYCLLGRISEQQLCNNSFCNLFIICLNTTLLSSLKTQIPEQLAKCLIKYCLWICTRVPFVFFPAFSFPALCLGLCQWPSFELPSGANNTVCLNVFFYIFFCQAPYTPSQVFELQLLANKFFHHFHTENLVSICWDSEACKPEKFYENKIIFCFLFKCNAYVNLDRKLLPFL